MWSKSLSKLLFLTPAAGFLVLPTSAALAVETTELLTVNSLSTESVTVVESPNLAMEITEAAQPLVPMNSTSEPATDVSDAVPLADVTTTETEIPLDIPAVDGDRPLQAPAAMPAEVDPSQNSTASVDALEELLQSEQSEEAERSPMGQVTSVTQLSDVRPTDWAYQALQSLVERYGCIAGYPDGTYRGNNFLTRYEFAAGLNACLDRINELLAIGIDGVTREDLAAIQRLQEEFAAELATLRGRVDSLEARVSELEANQFSTTTKLNGHAIFNFAAVFDQDEDFYDDQPTFGYRVRQNFDSSFSGSDRLRVRLQARDLPGFAGDPLGFSYGGSSGGNVVLDNLFYDFPLGDNIDVRIGANSLSADDLVSSTISPLDSSTSGSISAFGFPSQYDIAAPGDAGAGIIFQITPNLSLDLGYTSGDESNPANPSPAQGIFNGDYSMVGQLTYLSDFIDAAFTYIHAYSDSGFVSNVPEVANTYGFQTNIRISDGFEIGGGIAYAPTIILENGRTRVWSYQGTLAFPDLFGEGNLGGVLFGVPPRLADLTLAGERIPFLIDDASFLVEGFYLYRLNDNISITPGIVWITDPTNDNDIDDTVYGALRTVFSF